MAGSVVMIHQSQQDALVNAFEVLVVVFDLQGGMLCAKGVLCA